MTFEMSYSHLKKKNLPRGRFKRHIPVSREMKRNEIMFYYGNFFFKLSIFRGE